MIKFEFESHESTPEDQYIKEIVTFKFTVQDEKTSEIFYMPYFRKSGKDGQSFWDVATLGVSKFGSKKYDDKFTWDSRNREKNIKSFLDNRLWEKDKNVSQQATTQTSYYPHGMVQQSQPTSMSEVAVNEELPF